MSETRSPQIPSGQVPNGKVPPAKVRAAKAKFAEIVLVCRKCARRQGLTKGQARALVKAGYKAGRTAGRKTGSRAAQAGAKPRIVESGCLGPCPKRLLAVATGASVAAGRVLLLDPRDPAAAFPDLDRRAGSDFGPNAELAGRPGDASATDRGAPA